MVDLGVLEIHLSDSNEVQWLRSRIQELELLYEVSIRERQRLEFNYASEVQINLRLQDEIKELKKICMK